jgi:ligand-binding sensor domain-containing protein
LAYQIKIVKTNNSFLTLLLLPVIMMAQQAPDAASFLVNDEVITAQCESLTAWWIGTTNGVSMIKKKNMKTVRYTAENSMLPSNRITAICSRPDGQVYIGTDRGIMRYDRFSFMIINTENSRLASDNIVSLRFDADRGIIVTTDTPFLIAFK